MKAKSVWECTSSGYQSAKWMGRCPSCQAWNTMEESVIRPDPPAKAASRAQADPAQYERHAVNFEDLEIPEYMRSGTGMGELDRVLGGGIVNGSVVLLSGEPGIGKSTLLMQISSCLSRAKKVLYVSGEESQGQLKLRAQRLGSGGSNLYVMTATSVEHILAECDLLRPDILIVDSIQTMSCDALAASPGSISQVRESAMRFITRAKSDGTSVIMVGHVNKEGGIAGPKVLEHMVDAVLYFEGEKMRSYRIIRAIKNRYGSTNEIGVFEMTETGLAEVPNPSEMLLAGRPVNVSGNCAVCVMEGTRPLIAEVQVLVANTVFPSPKRTVNGLDYNRVGLLLAVAEKRLGLRFSTQDVYTNVVGGLHIDEPTSDMSVVMAMISGILDKPLPDDLLAIGEVGLAGECRAAADIAVRVREAHRLGFRKIVLPQRNLEAARRACGELEFIPIRSAYQALLYIRDKL